MPSDSAIEWTDATWNVWTGCTQISPGCAHCYAKELAETRFPNHFPNGFALTFHWERLDWPLHRKKPLKIFVNSMSDLFLEAVPDEAIDKVFAMMALSATHTFQVLTKRPERMASYLNAPGVVRRICAAAYALHCSLNRSAASEGSAADTRAFNAHQKQWWEHVGRLTAWTVDGGVAAESFRRHEVGRDYPSWVPWPLPHVWLGVSIENNRFVARADVLRQTPAAVRFLSCEPLLGPLPDLNLQGINWVIVGGESGPRRRPMELDWVRDLRDRTKEAGAVFFYKQFGGLRPGTNRLLDGRTWDEFPDAPATEEALTAARAELRRAALGHFHPDLVEGVIHP